MRISDWSSDVCSSDLIVRFETTSQRRDPMTLNAVVGQLMRAGMSPATRTRLEHSTGPNGLGGLDAQGGLGDVLSSFLGGDAAGQSSGGDGGLLGGISSMLPGSSGIGGLSRGDGGGTGRS